MKIKTENGEMNVTSQGRGSLNTVLGAVGTAGAPWIDERLVRSWVLSYAVVK